MTEVDESTTIRAGSYRYWWLTLGSHEDVALSVVATQPVDLFLLSPAAYELWSAGQPVRAAWMVEAIEDFEDSFRAPRPGEWVFIVLNSSDRRVALVEIELDVRRRPLALRRTRQLRR